MPFSEAEIKRIKEDTYPRGLQLSVLEAHWLRLPLPEEELGTADLLL